MKTAKEFSLELLNLLYDQREFIQKCKGNESVFPIYVDDDDIDLSFHNGGFYPHLELHDTIYHISYRLHDSVPYEQQQAWLAERQRLQKIIRAEDRDYSQEEKKRLRYLYSENVERFLDAGHGDCILRAAGVPEIIRESLEFFEDKRYILHAWCIMPNHIHVILQILKGHTMSEILHTWKSYTSHAIKKLLGRTDAVWQRDYYNHIIRTTREYFYQVRYVYNNPSNAGLGNVWPWRWTILER